MAQQARHGEASRGLARRGEAWHGKAQQAQHGNTINVISKST